MSRTQMVRLATVGSVFHARVIAARLGADGITTQLRGATEGPYPMGQVDVLVDESDVAEASQLLLIDDLESTFDHDGGGGSVAADAEADLNANGRVFDPDDDQFPSGRRAGSRAVSMSETASVPNSRATGHDRSRRLGKTVGRIAALLGILILLAAVVARSYRSGARPGPGGGSAQQDGDVPAFDPAKAPSGIGPHQ
ncbi:MAG: hypothetical protein ACT4OS_08305 [Acidimicrobiales bacterium]